MNYLEYAMDITSEGVGPREIAVVYANAQSLMAAVDEVERIVGEGGVDPKWRGGSPGSDYCIMNIPALGGNFRVVGFAAGSNATWHANEAWIEDGIDDDEIWRISGNVMNDRDSSRIIPFSNVEERFKKMMTIDDEEPDEDLDSFLEEFAGETGEV